MLRSRRPFCFMHKFRRKIPCIFWKGNGTLSMEHSTEVLYNRTMVYCTPEHRFGSDALLLARFCEPKRSQKAADLCSGCGIVALEWHDRGHRGPCTALELDPAASAATYVHDEHPWALFNPDGIAVDGVLVEAKTTADRANDRGWGRAGNGSVPAHYEAQVQWGLGILGLDRCLLAVLHGATNGRPDLNVARYRITADPAAFAFLLRRGQAFLEDLNQAKEAA